MANYQYTSDLLEKVLELASENPDGTSEFDSLALSYLNRAYTAVCMGGAEIEMAGLSQGPGGAREGLSEPIVWWWLRKDASLYLKKYLTGTITLTQGSASFTVSVSPSSSSKAGFHLVVDGHAGFYKIESWAGGDTFGTFDCAFAGLSGSYTYRAAKVEYTLAPDVGHIAYPIFLSESPYRSNYQSATNMRTSYPPGAVAKGVPEAFTMVGEQTILLNRFPDKDIRADYSYIARPTLLTNAANEEPLVPIQYRQILSDYGAYLLLLTKSDDMAGQALVSAKGMLSAMKRANQMMATRSGASLSFRPRRK